MKIISPILYLLQEEPMQSEEMLQTLLSLSKDMKPTLMKNNPMIGERPRGNPLGGMDELVGELTYLIEKMIYGHNGLETDIKMPKGI